MFSDDANLVPNHYKHFVVCSRSIECMLCWTVPSICKWTAEQQSLHMSGFLCVIYTIMILNTSVILERNETCLKRNENCLERNETCLNGNKTRSGNFWVALYVHYVLTLISHCTLLISANLISRLWFIRFNDDWHCMQVCLSLSNVSWASFLAWFCTSKKHQIVFVTRIYIHVSQLTEKQN